MQHVSRDRALHLVITNLVIAYTVSFCAWLPLHWAFILNTVPLTVGIEIVSAVKHTILQRLSIGLFLPTTQLGLAFIFLIFISLT